MRLGGATKLGGLLVLALARRGLFGLVLALALSQPGRGETVAVTSDVPGELWVRSYSAPAEAAAAPFVRAGRTPGDVELERGRYYDLEVRSRDGWFGVRRGSYPRVVAGAHTVSVATERSLDWPRVFAGLVFVGLGVGGGLAARARRLRGEVEAATLRARRAEAHGGDPTRIGDYRIVGRLGRGGMGTVYEVVDRFGDVYALKVSQGSADRFVREWETLLRCRHPGVVRLVDFFPGDEVSPAYLVMEKISGRTLSGPVPPAEAVRLVRRVLEALAYLHSQGVVHRDLKPDNVFVLPDGGVKLVDFGVSKWTFEGGMTVTGEMLGTPAYAAPEQLEARQADHRTDLYSVGVLLYELLTGRLPWPAVDPVQTFLLKTRGFEPLPPGIDPRLVELVTHLLAVRPEDRPADAAEVLERLP